jgi:hypothetical protein
VSFYHLPHPWNPGYAIPRYVMAEPPERGTFTTQWMPRGTIPNLVPDFFANPIEKKLLGRNDAGLSGLGSLGGCTLAGSTLAGSTLAGSTLAGSTLGASEYRLEPLGRNGMSGTITKYGLATARGMIARIRQLPNSQRAAALKMAMDRIDSTLRARCERYALEAQNTGMPAGKALELGLARALSEGVTSELARLGTSRQLPQPSSLLGLGLDCARSRAQGAPQPSSLLGLGFNGARSRAQGALGETPMERLRRLALAQPSGQNRPGEERQRKVTSKWKFGVFHFPLYDGAKTPTEGQSADDTSARVGYQGGAPNINLELPTWSWIRKLLVDDAQAILQKNPKLIVGPVSRIDEPITTAIEYLKSIPVVEAPTNALWQALGIPPGTPVAKNLIRAVKVQGHESIYTGGQILDKADFDGQGYIVSLEMGPTRAAPDWIRVVVRKRPKDSRNIFERAIGAIAKGAAGVINFVGDMTCNLVGTLPPVPPPAAGGMPAPPQVQAVAGGVAIAQGLCGKAPPPPMLYPPPSSILPWILLAGGGLLVLVLASQGSSGTKSAASSAAPPRSP